MSLLKDRVNTAVNDLEGASAIAKNFSDPAANTEFLVNGVPVKPIKQLEQEAQAAINNMSQFVLTNWAAANVYPSRKIYFIHNGIAYTPLDDNYTSAATIDADIAANKLAILQGLSSQNIGRELGKIPKSEYVPLIFPTLADAIAANLSAGQSIKTIGENLITDGRGREFYVSTTGPADGENTFLLNNGLFIVALYQSMQKVIATGTTTARSLADRFGDGVNVKDFGAIGDGSDATAAIAVAKAAGAVYMPDGSYPDSNNGEFYLYPSNMENDGGFYRYSVGGTTTQSSDPRPVMMIEKVVNTDKGALGNFDAGGLYVQINKRGGDALVTGITGYVKSITGVSDCIGVHGRVQLNGKNNNDLTGSEGFGGWSYCDINPTGGGLVTEGVGHEIDIRNRGGDIQFNKAPLPPGSTQGEYRGLVVVTADNSAGYCSHAIDVGAQTGSKGWYTGLRLRKDGIAPAVTLGIDTCQLRVQGALTSPNRYGGVSFDDGYLSYGLNFATGAIFDSDKAIILATNQKIFFDNNFRHLSWNGADYNFNQGGIAINGTRVINSQQPTIANATDAASAITQLNAVIATLKAHGLIAS